MRQKHKRDGYWVKNYIMNQETKSPNHFKYSHPSIKLFNNTFNQKKKRINY